MSDRMPAPPGTVRTLFLLLATARRRAKARQARRGALTRRAQRGALMHRRSSAPGGGPSGLLRVLPFLLGLTINVISALFIARVVVAAERLEAERHGRIVVDGWFATYARDMAHFSADPAVTADRMRPVIAEEASARARSTHGDADAIGRGLTDAVRAGRAADFVDVDRVAPGLPGIGLRDLPAMAGSLALLGWFLTLTLQGEGPDFDVGRRRHPTWEWLFSHPVPPRAVLLAEMLAPIAANPVYWAVPLFPGLLFGIVYGVWEGAAASILVGVPLLVAAACLGKAIEIVAVLRFPSRSRSAVLGVSSGLGSLTMPFIFALNSAADRVPGVLAWALGPLAHAPWPWLGLFLGLRPGGASFGAGVATDLGAGAVLSAAALALSVWATGRGLSAPVTRHDLAPAATRRRPASGRHTLLRKEALWFRRDHGALVQVILAPIALFGVQLLYLKGLFAAAQGHWASLCGIGILFGTYVLDAIGPKSLLSEASALPMALTWPRGLEPLLRAKARLWTVVSSAVVGPVLLYALWAYPRAWPGIASVAIGWLLFARSKADRAVTLARAADSAGEAGTVSPGRRWATQLGTVPFFVGVATRQWPLAIAGVVYGEMTSAAMWQNFRARLPYLMDPWSETLPRPPTLMHAMIAVSVLVEGSALLAGLGLLVFSRAELAAGRTLAYGLVALLTAVFVARFLSRRGVGLSEIWLWRATSTPRAVWMSLLAGVGAGGALGAFGCAYLAVLDRTGWFAEAARHAKATLDSIPFLRPSLFVAAVLVAPPAEEFLFRGLLYRALDREWRGWRAVAGSAAFFASYHPATSWLPVGLLGAGNALLFRWTGRLAASVVAHATYNAIVLGWSFGWI